MIVLKKVDVKWGPTDVDPYNAQLNHLSIVLERVLQTKDGKRFTRKNKNNPCKILRLHKLHQRSSKTNAAITTVLSQELARMKVADFDFPTQCLDIFDTKLEKFNEISTVDLPGPMTVSFLKSAIQGITALLSAKANYETIRANISTGTIPTYDQYFEYLMDHSKQLEVAITNDKTSRKANVAESGYEMLLYLPSNELYDEADVLLLFMVD